MFVFWVACTSYEVEQWKSESCQKLFKFGVVPDVEDWGLEFEVLHQICAVAKVTLQIVLKQQNLKTSGKIKLRSEAVHHCFLLKE